MKHCQWCDHSFQTNISYQIYCSVECRTAATKEKIYQRYLMTRVQNRIGKKRNCKNCGMKLSIYNDEQLCEICQIFPEEVKKILKEIKGLANGKDWKD
jgi:hypothetical protein